MTTPYGESPGTHMIVLPGGGYGTWRVWTTLARARIQEQAALPG